MNVSVEYGQWGNLMDLPEPTARAILGDAVYEALRRPSGPPGPPLRVTHVDHETKTITVSAD